MTGQKQRIIRRFEREAKEKLKKGNLSNDFINAMEFSLKEIKEIIGKPYDENEDTGEMRVKPITQEVMDVVQHDLKLVSEFLIGLGLNADKEKAYEFEHRAHKLTNAISWLNGWGDEEFQEEKEDK